MALMKTLKLSEIRKENLQRKDLAIKAVRKVNPDFVPGMRKFDKKRKDIEKEELLKKMREREYELKRR